MLSNDVQPISYPVDPSAEFDQEMIDSLILKGNNIIYIKESDYVKTCSSR